MATILDVPYRSQWDQDANKSNTDCGPACLAMVLDYYGIKTGINELLDATGAEPGRYVGLGQLQRVARSYGVRFQYGANYKLNDLKHWIDEGKPAIALVKYSYWSQIEPGLSTQDTFTGPHFVVVVGYGDGNLYINDPNYWPPRREEGYRKAWSEVLFNLAWSNVRTPSMANPNNAVIVPTVGKTAEVDSGPDRHQPEHVIEYIVQPNDTWTGLAGKFFNDQTRYSEILAFNHLPEGSALRIGQKLYIPLTKTDDTFTSPEKLVVLGEGAMQIVDATLVQELKARWVNKQKLAETADEATVLAEFLAEKGLWVQDEAAAKAISEVTIIQYVVQLGDSWAGIAGKMLGDQMRYPEIIAFNGLHPDVPLRVGQTIRIPPKKAVT